MASTGSNAHPTWRHVDEDGRGRTRDSIIHARAGRDPGSKRSSPTIHLTRKPQFFLFNSTNTICQVFGWDFDSDRLAAEIQFNTQKYITAFETNGDVAATSKDPMRAVAQYTAALSLNPLKSVGLFVKRSIARGNLGLWEDALKDADKVRHSSLGIGGL